MGAVGQEIVGVQQFYCINHARVLALHFLRAYASPKIWNSAMRASAGECSPLLFRNARPRTTGSDIPGFYDVKAQVWVVETARGFLPLVEEGQSETLETSTVTKVRQEADDNDMSCEAAYGGLNHAHVIAELVTKTEVQQESDDQIDAAGVIELVTKTATIQEQDDEDRPSRAFELETKTFADVEGDDESPMVC